MRRLAAFWAALTLVGAAASEAAAQLRFCNWGDVAGRVAVAQSIPPLALIEYGQTRTFRVAGWWLVAPKACVTIVQGDTTGADFLYYVEFQDGATQAGLHAQRALCVRRQAFNFSIALPWGERAPDCGQYGAEYARYGRVPVELDHADTQSVEGVVIIQTPNRPVSPGRSGGVVIE